MAILFVIVRQKSTLLENAETHIVIWYFNFKNGNRLFLAVNWKIKLLSASNMVINIQGKDISALIIHLEQFIWNKKEPVLM